MKVKRKLTEKGPIFATKYDPRMPALQPIIAKYWRSMVLQDKKQAPSNSIQEANKIKGIAYKIKSTPTPQKIPRKTYKRHDTMWKALH